MTINKMRNRGTAAATGSARRRLPLARFVVGFAAGVAVDGAAARAFGLVAGFAVDRAAEPAFDAVAGFAADFAAELAADFVVAFAADFAVAFDRAAGFASE